jgi:HAD superfamily hydrolase (TIGR01509 family)
MDLRNIELVSWDVDGTLYSRPRMVRALVAAGLRSPLAALRDVVKLERFRAQMARARRAGGRLPGPITRDRSTEARWYGPAIARAGLRPGVRELWAHFRDRGLRQVVLSDYHCDYKLAALGLEGAFEACYAGEALGFLKPAVEAFDAVQRAVQVPPGRILHVGDGARTDGAAVQAGWRVVILGVDFDEPADLLRALV